MKQSVLFEDGGLQVVREKIRSRELIEAEIAQQFTRGHMVHVITASPGHQHVVTLSETVLRKYLVN